MAHTVIETSTPAPDATIAAPPPEITLQFREDIRLTRVTATLPDGTETPLDLGAQTDFATDFALPFDSSLSGTFTITWRGLSIDGHAMNGSFGFTVQ